MKKATKAPTALQLFRQNKKINDLERKLRTEKERLRDMVNSSAFDSEFLNVEGEIYQVSPLRNSYNSYNSSLYVSHVASAEELSKVSG